MTPFRWEDSLSLDVPAIDRDHRHLMELLNRLHYMQLAGDERAAVSDVLWELIEYTQTHFRREEMLMRLSGYPEYNAHCRKHAALTGKVAEFFSRFQNEPKRIDIEAFSQFLNDWLIMHILGEDMKIKPYVEKLATAEAA